MTNDTHDPRCISLTDSEFNDFCDCETWREIDGYRHACALPVFRRPAEFRCSVCGRLWRSRAGVDPEYNEVTHTWERGGDDE